MKHGKYSIYLLICFLLIFNQSLSEIISNIEIDDLEELPSTYEEEEFVEEDDTGQEILQQVTQDLELQKEVLNDVKNRLARAEATWDMAENIFQQLADQVRQHEYDIKDLNR